MNTLDNHLGKTKVSVHKGHFFNLDAEYCVEVDNIEETEWSQMLSLFDDATVYQTWSYGDVRWGAKRLSHLVVRRHNRIVGLAQIIIIKLPIIHVGIAYVPWGPVWRTKEDENNLMNFRYTLRALKEIYARQQGLVARVAPNIFSDHDVDITGLLKEESYICKKDTYRTCLLDLSPSLDDLRKGLDQKWRNKLNRAEKDNLHITHGNTLILYDTFMKLYKEMKVRKQFNTTVDITQFRDVQQRLTENSKLRVLICEHEGVPIASLVGTAIGNTGIYLLGATGDKGLNMNGSYLLQWHMIKWLKETGYRYYDLGGIDPFTNPGVYHFKAGIGGGDLRHIGQYEICINPLSSIAVNAGELLKRLQQKRN